MEPDVSIETLSMVRVAVVPVGEVPHTALREYFGMLERQERILLSAISSFYTEHQKSPFAHQPWESGALRFKFILGGTPPSPWEDFQSNRKTLALIGICHCPSSPDLDSSISLFDLASRSFSSVLVQRCFAFFPNDSQLKDAEKAGDKLRLFPPSDDQTLEIHMQTMLQEIAASLLMSFEKWVLQAESTGTILKTPLDSQTSLNSEEVIKSKKRRLGRAQKTIGDYCLLAGSPIDANAHYATALELARLTGDFFWYAGSLEGSVCALLIDQMEKLDPVLEDEVRYRYSSAISHYRKSFIQENSQRVSPLSFELEASLKLARFFCRKGLVKDVVELLTSAAEGGKSLIDASDRLILFIEVARLFGAIGYRRKAAFFSRQVAQLYLQQNSRSAAISAMQVLALTTEAYHVQSKASTSDGGPTNEMKTIHTDNAKLHHQSIVSLFESQWSTLQMVVLKEILLSAFRADDPLTAWSAAARLLRSYYPLITPAGQTGIASALSNASERLPLGTRCVDPALPFVRLHSFPVHPSQMDIVKRNFGREDWWVGSAPSGPFIYTPFSKGENNETNKQEIVWVMGEPVQVLVELANPCAFELRVDSIYLDVRSNNFDAFPIFVNLPPNSSKIISLSGIPTAVGPINIQGCVVHCFGIVTEHLFKDVDNLLLGATQGLVLSDPFRSCGSKIFKNVTVPNISIVPALPLLVSNVIGVDGAIVLYEGEIRSVLISLVNAGTVSVDEAHISLSGRNQDSIVCVPDEILKSVLPLKPGSEVTLPITLKAWQLGSADTEFSGAKHFNGSNGRQVKDASSPTLLIHYAGPSVGSAACAPHGAIPPGRRLIIPLHLCVLQGLSFVKGRLLAMEIPAKVGEKYTPSAPMDNNFIKAERDCDDQMSSAVRVDPHGGSWGLRFLELELSNPTDVVFEVSVTVQMTTNEDGFSNERSDVEHKFPNTRVDRDYSARILIPLDQFKLPILDGSVLMKDLQAGRVSRMSSMSERNSKAELAVAIKNLISQIKVRWHSGRNSSGELNIKDAIQAALQASVMDILLPDPLTFCFKFVRAALSPNAGLIKASKSSVLAHEMVPMEVMVCNNTKETVKMSLNITCRDVTGENCLEGINSTILWAGALNNIVLEVLPLSKIIHSFALYFIIPGEYTLVAAAVIEEANEVLRTRARTDSPDEPIFCRGPPFHLVVEAA